MRPEAVPDGTGRDAAPTPAPAPVPAARAPAAPVAVRSDAFARLMAGQGMYALHPGKFRCGGTRGVRARARSSISGGLVRVQAGGCGRELNIN